MLPASRFSVLHESAPVFSAQGFAGAFVSPPNDPVRYIVLHSVIFLFRMIVRVSSRSVLFSVHSPSSPHFLTVSGIGWTTEVPVISQQYVF